MRIKQTKYHNLNLISKNIFYSIDSNNKSYAFDCWIVHALVFFTKKNKKAGSRGKRLANLRFFFIIYFACNSTRTATDAYSLVPAFWAYSISLHYFATATTTILGVNNLLINWLHLVKLLFNKLFKFAILFTWWYWCISTITTKTFKSKIYFFLCFFIIGERNWWPWIFQSFSSHVWCGNQFWVLIFKIIQPLFQQLLGRKWSQKKQI